MISELVNTEKFSLAIETSGTIGSIAIGRGTSVIESRVFDTPRNHAAEFLPAVQSLCQKHRAEPNQIVHVYVSYGPGSFTGLRIGITAARMLAFSIGAKVVPVPTLEVIAQNACEMDSPPDKLAVILDAKRKRVYAATFHRSDSKEQTGKYVAEDEPAEVDPVPYLSDICLSNQGIDCAVTGEGVACCRDKIESVGITILPDELHIPRAEFVYMLGHKLAQTGKFVNPRDLIPLYIRLPEAEEKWEKKHGSHSEPQGGGLSEPRDGGLPEPRA